MTYYAAYDAPYSPAGYAPPPPVYAAPPYEPAPAPYAYEYQPYEAVSPAPLGPYHDAYAAPPPAMAGYAPAPPPPMMGGAYGSPPHSPVRADPYGGGYGAPYGPVDPPPLAIEAPRDYQYGGGGGYGGGGYGGGGKPEASPWRDAPAPRGDRDDSRSVAASTTFSLAMTATTLRPGEPVTLKLVEELLLLKAGDKPSFAKGDRVLDQICALAVLYELWMQGRIAIGSENRLDARNVPIRLVDDAPTGSRMIDSAISLLKKQHKRPLTIDYWMQKAGKSLAASVLWRLVQKKKLAFDPRTLGPDKFPVLDGAAVASLREGIIRVVERMDAEVELHDQILAALYYLPKDATAKVFPYGVNDGRIDEARTIAKSAHLHLMDFKRDDHWI